ncbi:MAG: glycosyltransferase [Rhodobacteraceae bacterium]|nr:glycosyltransferase [Paracoccaceae bacterium]
MQLGYLMNTYPVTSATFIRREIAALEAQGAQIRRFAVRPWSEELVDPADKDEAARCTYLLAPGAARLVAGFLREGLRNPRGVGRAIGAVWTLWRNAGRGALVRHIAYLLEAVELKAQAQGLAHIHAHFSTNTATVALICARLGGPGFSFTAHGPDEFVDPAAASLALKLREARFAVAITHFARTQLALAGGMEVWDKTHVIRCGVEIGAPPQTLPSPDAPFVCVGRLCPQKAQTLLVEAMADLRQTHPQARLTLIGDGETRPRIEAAIARHGLDEAVTLMGWADNAAVRDALANARALVLPSFAEGLPIVLMEAHACARPVITTHIAGIPELVDAQSGWLVPAGDVPALVQAMRACMNTAPDDLAAMGRAGRDRVAAQHDLAKNATALKALFQRWV